MLRNIIVSHARKTKDIAFVGLENMPDIIDESEMRNQEYYAELYLAIQKLPEQRRKILELAAFDSLTYKEIADRLEISVNTVKTQMGRAYQFLKEELDPNNFVLFQLLVKSA
jgi:RNA polymerase sigma-70 factor (ECF subfamily)